MKFRNKPKIINAEEFYPHEERWPVNVCYINGSYKVWNNLHSSYITVKPGDWIRIDNIDDTYPIDRAYIEENYEVCYDES